jgi:polysaccharide export outer membrane protein
MLRVWQTHVRRNLLILAAAGFLTACSTTQPFGGAEGLTLVQTAGLPAPSRENGLASDEPSYIAAYDKLVLTVFGMEGLEKVEVQVDGSGRITFPIIGAVEVGGKTVAEVQQEIRSRLQANFVRDPQVAVNLMEAADRVVTIEGQVTKPGSYPIIGRTSLLRAVANAGSPTEFAKLKEVVVFREVAGQRYAALYDMAAIRRGVYSDPEIFANDLVVVDESRARRLFKDLLQVAPLLSTPLVVALQSGN